MPGATLYPFIVSTLAWEGRPGQWNLTVCLKATFALAPHRAPEEPALAAQQDGPHDDVLFEQAPHASLYSPSDFVPYKPRADILLVGHAHAPSGAAVESLVVRIRLGDFSKALRVTGDRSWTQTPQGPRASQPRPFTRLPLRYERAWRKGENMAGIPAGDTTRPPPNVDVVLDEGPAETPGLGPVAASWRALRDPRAQEALIWAQRLRSAPGPAPAGLAPAVFNAAPRDQQVAEIAPSALLVLENLHPRFARLETRLPSVVPSLFHVDPATGQPRALQARIDTLWIDTDREVFVVSWRAVGTIAAPGSIGVGRVLVAAHPPGATVTFEEVDALTRANSVPPAAGVHDGGSASRQPAGHDGGSRPQTPGRRSPPATMVLPAMPMPTAEPFPLATPAASPDAGAPIAGAPWAGLPVAPAPKPGKHLETTLPLGASLAAFVPPAAPGPGQAPKRKMATLIDRIPVDVVTPAPFPLASPGTGASAQPIAGAPWAAQPAAPVPRPGDGLGTTLPLGASLVHAVARAQPDASVAAPPVAPPAAGAALPPEVTAPPEPLPAAAPPPPAPAAPPGPPKVVWRVDAPEAAPAPKAPAPADAPPPAFERPAAAAVRGSFYSKFVKK